MKDATCALLVKHLFIGRKFDAELWDFILAAIPFGVPP